MASVTVFNLTAGTALASGDVLVFCDISNTSQSANGSDLKITITNFFATVPVPIIVTSASANALAVGLAGTTDPAFLVDASTATSATGLKVKSAAAAAGVALSVISSGADENLTIDAKGAGTITIAGTSTGRVTITPVTTITGVLTLTAQPILSSLTASQSVQTDGSKGLVSLANTGTGNNVLSAGPTMTGTIGAASMTLSGTLGLTGALTYGGVTLSAAVTGTGDMVLSASPTLTGTITAAIANFSGLVTFNGGATVASGQTLTVSGATITGLTAASVATGTFPGIYTVTGALTLSSTLAVTGTSTLTGNVGIGGPGFAHSSLYVATTVFTGTSQYGIAVVPTFTSGATGDATGIYSRVKTAVAAFTVPSGYAFYAVTPVIGAGSAITTQYGFYAQNQGAAGVTNAYGVYIAAQSGAATTNIGLYNAGTTHLSNIVGILTAPVASQALTILVNGNLTGTGQIGIVSDIVSSSAATNYLYGAYVRVQTAASAFTVTTARAVVVAAPSLGATSAITTNSGVYVGNQGAAGITNAYGIYIEAVSGAATTNIGLYNAGTTTLVGNVSMSGNFNVTGAASSQSAGVLSIGGTQQTTVGAAGAASAPPATPSGYIKTYIGATQFVIPYYAQA